MPERCDYGNTTSNVIATMASPMDVAESKVVQISGKLQVF